MKTRTAIALPSTALLLIALPGGALLAQEEPDEEEPLEFSELSVHMEVNDTDGDAGLQLFFDADGWRWISVRDPEKRQLLEVKGRRNVRQLGLTEGFFESEEPSFDEMPLEDFIAMFPEGTYRFYGTTIDGKRLYGEAEFTHDIPLAPEIVSPAPTGDDECTADVAIPAQIVWSDPNTDIETTGFEIIVEREEPTLQVFSVELPPDTTMLTVPAEFLEPDVEYKFEIIADEASGNRTITENCFVTAE